MSIRCKRAQTKDAFNGAGTHLSVSLFGVEASHAMDIDGVNHRIGGNWRAVTVGGSFGSSSIAGGSGGVSFTIPLFNKVKF